MVPQAYGRGARGTRDGVFLLRKMCMSEQAGIRHVLDPKLRTQCRRLFNAEMDRSRRHEFGAAFLADHRLIGGAEATCGRRASLAYPWRKPGTKARAGEQPVTAATGSDQTYWRGMITVEESSCRSRPSRRH
jgi:hypothetical protein